MTVLLLVLACSKSGSVEPSPVGVVVARQDIDLGTALSPDLFEVVDVPAWGEGILVDPKDTKGRFAGEPLLAGEPVRTARLVDRAVPEGRIAVKVTGSPVGPVGSGDYVDLVPLGPGSDAVVPSVRVMSVHDDGLTVAAPAGTKADGAWAWMLQSPVDATGADSHGAAVPLDLPPGADAWVALRDLTPGVPLQPGVDVVAVALPPGLLLPERVGTVTVVCPEPDVDTGVPEPAPCTERVMPDVAMVATPVMAGEPLLRGRAPRPATLLPREMRGITVDVDSSPSVTRGSYTDVVVARPDQTTMPIQATFVLDRPTPRTITVLVLSKQGVALARASHSPDARVALAVRNDLDDPFVDQEPYPPQGD